MRMLLKSRNVSLLSIAFAVTLSFLAVSCNKRGNDILEDVVTNRQGIDELFRLYESSDGLTRLSYANAIFYQMVNNNQLDTLYKFSSLKEMGLCEATLMLHMSDYALENSDFQHAQEYAERAISYFENYPEHDVDKALGYRNIGVCLTKSGDFEKALQLQVDALNIIRESGDNEVLAYTLYTLAGTCCMMRQYETAKGYIDDALRIEKSTSVMRIVDRDRSKGKKLSNRSMINYLNIASVVYSKLGQFDASLRLAKEAYEQDSIDNGQANLPTQHTYVANVYIAMGEWNKAAGELEAALEILKEYPSEQVEATIHSQLGNIERQKGNYESAEYHYNLSLDYFRKIGNKYAEKNVLQSLSRVHLQTDPVAACQDLQQYIRMTDSMNIVAATKSLNDYRVQYETDQLELLAEKQKLHTKTIVWVSFSILVLLFMIVLVLSYLLRMKEKAKEREEQFFRTKSNFFTNITHEFRTPLTVILGYGQQMRNNVLPEGETMQKVGEMITRQGSQMLSLINQLLDLIKVTSEAIQPEYYSSDVVSYVRMIVESHESLAKDKKIEMVMKSEHKNFYMDFVPDYMHKIVRNLISNSVKFTPEGGRITVSLSFPETNLVLKISDTGVGIPKDEQKHIFEEFYQLSTGNQYAGTGIGLSLVVQIVRAMGGTVNLESELGEGSTFIITLPQHHEGAKKEDLNEVVGDEIPVRYSYTNEQLPVGVTDADAPILLVVEDNEDISRYIASQLRNRYRLYYAFNGNDGLTMANEIVPNLILSDLMMPGMNGTEFCEEVRRSPILNHIPFVMLTAKTTEEDKVYGLKCGADLYLYKPFNAEELNVSVEHLIMAHRTLKDHLALKAAEARAEEETTKENVAETVAPDIVPDTLMEAKQAFLNQLGEAIDSMLGKTPIDVQSLSAAVGMSSRQLSRKIQTITGESTINFLVQYRVERAKELLQNHPELTIAEVAAASGFEDGAYFSRVFKQETGVSPTQYKKQG